MSRSLYLIDGHSQIFRAYYAPIGPLTAPSGEPTRATYVFCQMLLGLVRDRAPDYLAMPMDVSDETVFRREIDPQYKAQREPPPEDLPQQIERIVCILEAIGIPILRVPRYEADDIMATLAARFADEDLDVYLVSRDKDLEQLLTQHVAMYDPFKSEVITPERLVELKGWSPQQAVDAQALVGDTVDNVPGVPGIGPKTAAKLLRKYGSAQAVIEHADELSPKQRQNVKEFASRLETTLSLVRLTREVPVDFDLKAADVTGFDWQAAAPLFRELGFKRLVDQLPGASGAADDANTQSDNPTGRAPAATRHDRAPSSAARPDDSRTREANPATAFPIADATLREPDGGTYTLVDSAEAFRAFADDLARQREFALDTETTSIRPVDAELVGLSFSWQTGQGWYVPVRSMFGRVVPGDLLRDLLGPILTDETVTKVGHNLKYDLIVLREAGLPVTGPLFDTMVAAFAVDPTRTSYGLDRLVLGAFEHAMIPITDLIGKGRDQLSMDQVPLEHTAEYASEDADYTWRLRELLLPQLSALGVDTLFYETEMPLLSVLTDMEHAGVRVDVDFLRTMSRDLAARADRLVAGIHEAAGEVFNIDSPKQLGGILFDKLGFRIVRRTRTARSTDAETLTTLARETEHPILGLLLEYRELQKLRGTYVDALPAVISRRTGRVHTCYHQTGAITGRLSSSEPNLQNIPVRTELGREIRRAFVPRSADELLIVADYSQVELRVLAHFCEDEALVNAFAEDRDIHAVVAAQVNGVTLEDVTKDMRARAKAVNFGIIYGQTAFGLSQTTGMNRGEAQAFIDAYFRQYPRIRAFIDRCIEDARTDGFVRTIQGRRRPIANIDSRNRMARAQAERLAVNTVVQGSAAELIKVAMVQLGTRIRAEQLPLRILLQVHDELVCEAPRAAAADMAEIIRAVMSGALPLSVPLKVEAACGENWLEAK